jgi:hypothetical protein
MLKSNKSRMSDASISLEIRMYVWDIAQWYSVCLACERPWVATQHQKRKDQKKKKKERKKTVNVRIHM